MTLSVIIPLFNEEENVPLLYEKLKEFLESLKKEYEILFVDDGSADRTLSILEEIQSKDNRVIVLSLRRNFGQTAAFAA
jgi:glycosyltransferase involved in cell wall biosynthesis